MRYGVGLVGRRVVPLMLLAALGLGAGQSLAAELKPYQQTALEKILATMDPQFREAARLQLEQTLSMLGEEQVELMLSAMEQQAAADEAPVAEETADEPELASAEDLAYNRSQYEPVVRELWALQKSFDDFVDAALAANCPERGAYAVFGSAWRYEVYPLQPEWIRATGSVDTDVQILGQSYVPQDGRYDFDFTDVRRGFDKARVEAAVKQACAEYSQVGEAFMAEARPLADAETLDGISRLEQRANAGVSPIAERLKAVLEEESPSANGALYRALLNGRKID